MTTVPVSHEWQSDRWDWPLQHEDGVVKVINTPEKFEVGLEVHYFTPKEVEVKVAGHELVVHCRHEERTDQHGKITREIFRTYHLPPDVEVSSLKSHLNQAGVLVVTANKKK